jgi:hypothetical protein
MLDPFEHDDNGAERPRHGGRGPERRTDRDRRRATSSVTFKRLNIR